MIALTGTNHYQPRSTDMTAKKIQPTNPATVPVEAKDASDKISTRKTAVAGSKHRTSGRKTNTARSGH